MSQILTVQQTAEKLQLTTDVVREYLRTGKLPGRKVGKSWRVLETDLEQWISAGHSGPERQFVSARGLLKKYPGKLTSEEVNADKRLEAELEEAKLRKHVSRRRKSA